MPFIDVIQHKNAEGRLLEIYDDLVQSRGKLAEVHKIQSLNPETIVAHMELYLKIMFGRSPLRRYQREMMAVVVSVCNNCLYCTKHHAEAVQHFWKDDQKVQQLIQDYTTLELSTQDRLLCDLAKKLTEEPSQTNNVSYLGPLKATGLNDRAILDATLVIAYFNFVNRIVLGLGVNLEEDGGTGYKYD
ncbi:MAG: peroxidase-related enzyme [Aureispira sp.]|nr:peroxidase-related enzyme [Aureispira sp.]